MFALALASLGLAAEELAIPPLRGVPRACYCGGVIGPMTWGSTAHEQALADNFAPSGSEVAVLTQVNVGHTYFCCGGCDGNTFKSFEKGRYVKSFTAWFGQKCGYPQTETVIQKFCWKWSNGKEECVGGNRMGCTTGLGTPKSYTFEEGEKLNAFITGTKMGRNQNGRVNLLRFDTIKPGGAVNTYIWGSYVEANIRLLSAVNVGGKVLSGFYGKADHDLNQIGLFVTSDPCTDSHAEITSIKCVNKHSSGGCLASWRGTGHYIGAKLICNNCNLHSGKATCSSDLSWSTTSSVELSSSQMNQISASLGLTFSASAEFNEGFFFSAKQTVSTSLNVNVGYEHSWTSGKSTTQTFTGSVGNTCDITVPDGQMATINGNLHAGTMRSDLEMTVTTYTTCGTSSTTAHTVTMTVDDVPGVGAVASCVNSSGQCPNGLYDMAAPVPMFQGE